MTRYTIFGSTLDADVELPELRPAPAGERPRWTLRTSGDPAPRGDGWTLLGEEPLSGPHRVRLLRSPAAVRLEYTDTGTFDIAPDGEVTWHPGPEAAPENVRADVIGRVLATALHAAGTLCLHGSAVALSDGAVGFLAPRGYGKSTLAGALTAAGARLVTDDTLAVQLGRLPVALPGVHSMRMWGDSSERVGARLGGGALLPGVKHTVTDLPARRVALEPVPLRSLYVLGPVRVTDGAWVCRRLAMPPAAAALSLVGHGKLGPLLSHPAEIPVLLERSSALAAVVPVYALQVERDWARLDDVVGEICRWHGGAGEGARSVAGALP